MTHTERRIGLRRALDRDLHSVLLDPGGRRAGDNRPFLQPPTLTVRPAHDQPFRWIPRQGEPLCIGEWFTQSLWRHRKLLFTVLMLGLTLILALPNLEQL